MKKILLVFVSMVLIGCGGNETELVDGGTLQLYAPYSIIFCDSNLNEVLRFCSDGNIVWTYKGEKIIIDDAKMLCASFMDFLTQNVSNGNLVQYLEPLLYKEYQQKIKEIDRSKK